MENNISINQYIDSLDYDQLCNLIDKAKDKKLQKDNEKKLFVHQVSTDLLCENFRTEDIEGAAKFIGDYVMKIAKSDEDLSEKVYRIKQVRLNSFKEVESEYESWFE